MGEWSERLVLPEAWCCLYTHWLLHGEGLLGLWHVLCHKTSVSQRHEACGGESTHRNLVPRMLRNLAIDYQGGNLELALQRAQALER